MRGGIVASVPLARLRDKTAVAIRQMAISHGGFWLIGIAAIAWIGRKGRHIQQERAQSESELQELYIKAASLPPITVSIGVAEYWSDVGQDAERFLSLADEALYRAKASGRDRIVIFSESTGGACSDVDDSGNRG